MGETPLIRSVHNGHYGTVRFLVERGADVNALDMVRPRWQRGGFGSESGAAGQLGTCLDSRSWASVRVGTAEV